LGGGKLETYRTQVKEKNLLRSFVIALDDSQPGAKY